MQQITLLAGALSPVSFAPGSSIIRQGDKGDKFYIIQSGSVRVTQVQSGASAEMELARLGPGNYFGELSLLNDEPRMVRPSSDPVPPPYALAGQLHCE
jgi:cAMP-dependent protein kinase regulator